MYPVARLNFSHGVMLVPASPFRHPIASLSVLSFITFMALVLPATGLLRLRLARSRRPPIKCLLPVTTTFAHNVGQEKGPLETVLQNKQVAVPALGVGDSIKLTLDTPFYFNRLGRNNYVDRHFDAEHEIPL